MDRYLEAKFPEEANKLIMKIDTNKAEAIDVRDRHDNQLTFLQDKLTTNWDKIMDLERRVDGKLGQLDKGNKEEQEKRERDHEVQILISDMINTIAGT